MADLAEKYAPTKNATNDPNGQNKHWLPNVTSFRKQFEALSAPIPAVVSQKDGSTIDTYALSRPRTQNDLLFDDGSVWEASDATRMRDMMERALRNIKKRGRQSWPPTR
jgi:hypothetical protein